MHHHPHGSNKASKNTRAISPPVAQTRTEPDVQRLVQRLRPFAVPADLAKHPLVAGKYFYTLPARLLNLVVQNLGSEQFDHRLLEVEAQLSTLTGDHAVYVGLRREAPIAYDLLEQSRPLKIPYEMIKGLGWGKSEEEIKEIERIATPRLRMLSEPLRGYCGWLMTDPQFIGEHDQLLGQYRREVLEHDLSQADSCLIWAAAASVHTRRAVGRRISRILQAVEAPIPGRPRTAPATAYLASIISWGDR